MNIDDQPGYINPDFISGHSAGIIKNDLTTGPERESIQRLDDEGISQLRDL